MDFFIFVLEKTFLVDCMLLFVCACVCVCFNFFCFLGFQPPEAIRVDFSFFRVKLAVNGLIAF